MAVPIPPDRRDTGDDRSQRVRVGVTGLAAILLVVAVATAIASGVRNGVASQDNVVAPPPVVATEVNANATDVPSEPLAQLGAAPGTVSDEEQNASDAKAR